MKSYSLVEKLLFPPTYVNKKKLYQNLTNKTIIITGASSGIGAQLANDLGDIHCQLILVARRKEKLQEVQKNIKTANVSIFQADLRNPDDRKEFLQFIQQTVKKVDVFVHNAGLSIRRSIFDSLNRFHDFKRTMAINYMAPVEIMLTFIPYLEKANGHVINISTVNALIIPFPHFAAYQASKQAFDTWFQSVELELNAKGITMTSIYLPLVETPMIEPTPSYQKMPSMSVQHVAKIISKLLYTKKNQYKPWWIVGAQVSSLFFRNTLRKLVIRFLKRVKRH